MNHTGHNSHVGIHAVTDAVGTRPIRRRRRHHELGKVDIESQGVVVVQIKTEAGTGTQGGRDEVSLVGRAVIVHLATDIVDGNTPSEVGIHIAEPFDRTLVEDRHVGGDRNTRTFIAQIALSLRQVGIDKARGHGT